MGPVILFFYQILAFLAIVLVLPFLVLRGVFPIRGLSERFGKYGRVPPSAVRVWFHVASVGELKAAASLIPLLKAKVADLYPVISVVTKTGKQKALSAGLKAAVYYAPLEIAPAIIRAARTIRPELLILAETELWPLLIRLIRKSGAKVVIVNGRISSKSLKHYRFFRFLFRPVLQDLDLIMAQTETDRNRFIEIGASPERVETYGNIKFDQINSAPEEAIDEDLGRFLQRSGSFVFVAGSVRRGEIKILLSAIERSLATDRPVIAVIAPRHMKDLPAFEKELASNSIVYTKRSELAKGRSDRSSVLLLDSMGELSRIYRYCHLAFVGGSLVSIGGHDPLEPASAGCALCFGPFMQNNQYAASKLLELNAAREVAGAGDLSEMINYLADNRSQAALMGARAKDFVKMNAGVSEKTAHRLLRYLQ